MVDDFGEKRSGPYGTQSEAEAKAIPRLQAPEQNQTAEKPRWIGARMSQPIQLKVAPGVSFDAWPEAGKVRAGVWDRWTSWGTKDKDGDVTVFDEVTLTQAVTNFGNQQNDLYLDYDHQTAYVETNGKPAIALAWYCALAGVRNGKVFAFATHRDEVQPPDASALEDGLYAYRSEVTDAGQDLLSGGKFRFLSPMFVTDGKDEQGNELGYLFYCAAATNNPFQDGVALTLSKEVNMAAAVPGSYKGQMQVGQRVCISKRDGKYTEGTITDINLNWGQALISWDNPSAYKPWVPFSEFGAVVKLMDRGARGATKTAGAPGTAKRETNMVKMDDGALLKRLGLGDDASPEALRAAFGAYMARMDEEAALKKLADDDGADTGDGNTSSMDDDDASAMAGDVDEAGGLKKLADDDDASAMEDSATAMDDATPAGLAGGGDAKASPMRRMAKDLGLPEDAKPAQIYAAFSAKFTPSSEVAKLQKRLAKLEAERRSDAEARVEKLAKDAVDRAIALGRQREEKREVLMAVAKRDLKEFESLLDPKGTWSVFKRITSGGELLSKGRSEAEDFGGAESESDEVGAAMAVAARKYAKENKVPLIKAYEALSETSPHLYRRSSR